MNILYHESDEAYQQGRCCVGYIHIFRAVWRLRPEVKEEESEEEESVDEFEKSSPIPGNWKDFLLISENKTELFYFLVSNVTALEIDKQIIRTYHEEILCTQPRDMLGLAPCTQEEANPRIMLHLKILSWKEIPRCQFVLWILMWLY